MMVREGIGGAAPTAASGEEEAILMIALDLLRDPSMSEEDAMALASKLYADQAGGGEAGTDDAVAKTVAALAGADKSRGGGQLAEGGGSNGMRWPGGEAPGDYMESRRPGERTPGYPGYHSVTPGEIGTASPSGSTIADAFEAGTGLDPNRLGGAWGLLNPAGAVSGQLTDLLGFGKKPTASLGVDTGDDWTFDPALDLLLAGDAPVPDTRLSTREGGSSGPIGSGSIGSGSTAASSGLGDDAEAASKDLNWIQRIAQDRFGLDEDTRNNLSRALMSGGFGMMTSDSPFVGQAIGEGGMLGVRAFQDSKERDADDEARMFRQGLAEEANARAVASDARSARSHQMSIEDRERAIAEANRPRPLDPLSGVSDKHRSLLNLQMLYEAGQISEAAYKAVIGSDALGI